MPLNLNNLKFRDERIINKYFISISLHIILEDNQETYVDIFCSYASLDTKIIDKLNRYEEMKNHKILLKTLQLCDNLKCNIGSNIISKLISESILKTQTENISDLVNFDDVE
jgi:hypothetical protein